MRKFLALSFILLLAVSLSAQVRTGNIYGRAVDTEGNTLPGVSVTLTGQYTAPLTTVTSPEGAFRFLSLPAASDYAVRLELTGFKTKIEENIVVVVGGNVNLTVAMEVGTIEEAITVTAVSPIVDQKKTSVGQNVTQDILQSLPSARDPWVILQMAPGVIADRENVGGTESGMQSTMTARGTTGYGNNVWAMDGVVITDPAAIGASPSYYDFDAFEEMQITVGGADVTVQTGGIALNLVTRRGGNRVSLGGRFYYTDGEKFQGDNLTQELIDEGLARTNRIRIITDYGFNLGAPIIKDKAWFWGSFGVQDIQTTTIQDIPFDTLLTNFAAKINLQLLPANRFEAFIHAGKKEMWGRDSSPTFLPGRYQGAAFHFGSPIIKFQDEHMFGDNLFLSAKYSFSNAGFNLTPMNDRNRENWARWSYQAWQWLDSWWLYAVDRPHTQAELSGNYFNDTLFGVSHEIKVGALYSARAQKGSGGTPGNIYFYGNYRPQDIAIDYNADGFRTAPLSNWYRFYLNRGSYREYFVDSYSGYFSDTISVGRLTLTLGARYDYQKPFIQPFTIDSLQPDHKRTAEVINAQTQAALLAVIPGVDVPGTKALAADGSAYSWQVLSPRIGLVWDVTGDGKTLAKLNLAQYGDFMGVGHAWYWEPGGTGGWLSFWWEDDGTGIMDFSDLYWLRSRTAGDQWLYAPYPMFDSDGNFVGDLVDGGGYYYGGYDPANPDQLTDPFYSLDRNAGSSKTSEVLLTLEREVIPDFALALNATFRRMDNFNWSLKYFPATDTEVNADMFVNAGRVPATLPGLGTTGQAADHDYYYANTAFTAYSPYYNLRRQPNRYNDFYSVDLIFNKRLSNKWMLNGSFTLQNQAAIYGEGSYLSPTNIWAFNNRPYAPLVGGAAGKINQYTWSRWLFKAGGLYQLPYGFNVSFQFNAREGWLIRETFTFRNMTIPNPASRSHTLDMSPFASDRMPLFYNLSFRLEKEIRAGDFGRIYIMADVFNALNSSVENRRYQKYHGTYTWYGDDDPANIWSPDPLYYQLNEILNPRVFRLGVRFQF